MLVLNEPETNLVQDYLFYLNFEEDTSDQVNLTNVTTHRLTTVDNANVYTVAPTQTYKLGKGIDEHHFLELSTVTLAMGEKEFGTDNILWEKTTYSVISSKIIKEGEVKFYLYGWAQQSQQSYYYFTSLYILDTWLIAVGQHVLNNEIVISQFKLDPENYKLIHVRTRKFKET